MRKTGKQHEWSKDAKPFCHRCGMDKPRDPARLAKIEGDCRPIWLGL